MPFKCNGCKCWVPNNYSMRTPGFCYLCDPAITLDELLSVDRIDRTYNVTGTFHGSIVIAKSEGEARRMFHAAYNGESIVSIQAKNYNRANL